LVHHLASRGHQNLKKRWFQVLALALTAAFVTASCIGSGGRRSVKVVSPDGKNIITLACPEKAGVGPPTFAIARSGRQVILPSAFKIELSDKGDMAAGAKILMVQEDRADETFVMLWGKAGRCVTVSSGLGCISRIPTGPFGIWNSVPMTTASPLGMDSRSSRD
jgi:hypothetical protein